MMLAENGHGYIWLAVSCATWRGRQLMFPIRHLAGIC